jgi:hypothetical protein
LTGGGGVERIASWLIVSLKLIACVCGCGEKLGKSSRNTMKEEEGALKCENFLMHQSNGKYRLKFLSTQVSAILQISFKTLIFQAQLFLLSSIK